MMLAGAAGVRVAEAWLVDPEEVIGIPAKYIAGGPSLAVGRFDRKSSGHRIHIEDFAQIYQVIGDQKYATGNEATIMRTVQRFATDGRGEMLESVRRVTTNILLGNGDAHLKNWSFIYPEPGVIALSPAYDIVPTFAYGDSTMAMKLGGTNNPYIMGAHKFERVAGLLQVDPRNHHQRGPLNDQASIGNVARNPGLQSDVQEASGSTYWAFVYAPDHTRACSRC